MLKKLDLIVIVAIAWVVLSYTYYSQPLRAIKSRFIPQPPRNIILICTDTIRYDSFTLPETRNYKDSFSKWSDRAIRFRNVQSPASWTVPTIASVMSGLYPAEHEAGHFRESVADLGKNWPSSLSENVPTLQKILQERKFETFAFSASPFVDFLFHGKNAIPGTGTKWQDREIVENANEWLKRFARPENSKSFFLYLHFLGAHDEHWNSLDLVRSRNAFLSSEFKKDISEIAPAGICYDRDFESCQRYQAYLRSVLSTRNKIATLLSHLEETGLLEHTIVILFSDHVEEFHDHLAEQIKMASNPEDVSGEGHGRTLYQELLHVPMFVWHPSYSSRDINIPVSLVDIAPTVADWLSLKDLNVQWSGKSLAEIKELDEKTDLLNRPIFSSGIAYGMDKVAVRFGEWKSIRNDSGSEVLYNLASDPMERRILKGSGAGLVLNRFSFLYLQKPINEAHFRPPLDESDLNILQSIGYLGMAGQP